MACRSALVWGAAVVWVFPGFAGCLVATESGGKVEPATTRVPAVPGPLDGATFLVLSPPNSTLEEVLSRMNHTLPVYNLFKVVDRVSGEPTLGVGPGGSLWYAAIDWDGGPLPGVNMGSPKTWFMRSSDGGRTWEPRNPHVAGFETHPQTSDPYVHVDPLTGRVYALDMGPNVLCNKVSISDDDGETWITQPLACNTAPNDHPTLFTGPRQGESVPTHKNVAYLCVNQIYDTVCYVSPDGGLAWIQTTPPFLGVDPSTGALCGGLNGHGAASWVTGSVFLGRDHCGAPKVAVSHDQGRTWNVKVLSTHPEHRPSEHDVQVAVDTSGHVYAFWLGAGGRGAFLSVSHDDGETWSAPVNVTPPRVTALKLPSLTAGAEGRVAFLFVGTEAPLGSETFAMKEGCTNTHNASCFQHPEMVHNATWHAYIGTVVGAHRIDSGEATVVVTRATPEDSPLKRGPCSGRCFGTRGASDGGMYDFLDITFDPREGSVVAALVDVCHKGCDGPGHGYFDKDLVEHSVGTVARLVAGPRLLEAPLAETLIRGR